jgi:hypothetical protein
MKKIFALLLTLSLCLFSSSALGDEAEMLRQDEMIGLRDELVEMASSLPAETLTVYEEDGTYRLDYDAFALYSDQTAIADDTVIDGLEITPSESTLSDMRGLKPGDSLEQLLAAYPLDNPSLSGTYDEAVLYISGELPGTVNTGRLVRDGSRALVVEHAVYAAQDDEVYASYVVYTLQDDVITAIQVLMQDQPIALDEAKAELEALSLLQAKTEYSAYRSDDPEELAAEDLYFGGFDFIYGTPEQLIGILGTAQSDTWQQDGSNYLRILQWDGAQAIFNYDSARSLQKLNLLEIYEDLLEGPRGMRIGDTLTAVIGRVRHDAEDALYGDGTTAPYGRCSKSNDGTADVVYAISAEDGTVLLRLTVVEGRLADMTCSWR